MNIMKIAIWDLCKAIAKIEDIDMEHILPISVINTPTYHNSNNIMQYNKEHKGKLRDIGNTILCIWPKYLEIVLGHLGKFMPLELP